MKMQVLGVKRVEGTGKETGNAFDMCRVVVSVPIETGAFGKEPKRTIISGYGFESAEIECAPEALPMFAKLKFPCEIDLHTDQRLYRGKFETVCVGVVGAASPVKAVG